jgi:hypothetical protein
MWDAKMKGDVYTTQLEATKPLALPRVAEYQATHESLISIVKTCFTDYPEESSILQEYMWYAEKLWRLSQTYTSQALQNEADALFLWYLAKGRKEDVLRRIAEKLGIIISSSDEIFQKIGATPILKIIKKDTIIADGTEQTLLEYLGTARISGNIDLHNMANGDTVTIKVYIKVKEDQPYTLHASDTYENIQDLPILHILPTLSGVATKITLQQTSGTYKSFSYIFTRG